MISSRESVKRPRVEFLRQAATEVEEALEWYSERSILAASEFLQEVDRAIQLAVERPGAWPLFEAGTQRIVMQRYPYSIIFRAVPGIVQVVAVAHHKRKPGYWRQRRSGPTRR
jgi:plasmid stabilization system protein ParE